MTNFDDFNPGHRDMVAHASIVAEPLGDGERDYAEHVRSQRLSGSDRLIVLGAVVLLGLAAFAGHFTTPVTDQITTSAIATPAAADPAPAAHHHRFDFCREYSPYAEKSC